MKFNKNVFTIFAGHYNFNSYKKYIITSQFENTVD